MVDRYTKIALTVIAAALVGLPMQQTILNATAQPGAGATAQVGTCGSNPHNPCFVTTVLIEGHGYPYAKHYICGPNNNCYQPR